MKALLLLTLALLTGGCTVVGVREPVGTALPDEKTEEFVGRWLGPKKMEVTVARSAGSLVATWDEDGKTKHMKFTVTKLADDFLVGWGELDDSPFLAPVRLVPGEEAIILLSPDEQEVEALIAAGTLQRAPEGTKSNLFLEPAGVLAAMSKKSFWKLSWAVPLLKEAKDRPPVSADVPPAKSPP